MFPVDEMQEPPVDEMVEELAAPMEAPLEPQVDEEDIANALRDILRAVRDEDRAVRDTYLYMWRRLEYYWNNIVTLFADPVTPGNWVVPNWAELPYEIPPRLINIYRPHGEAIVAALSVTVPATVFYPDDSDNPDDVETSKGYRAISELLQLHNEAPMLWIKCLVGIFNQGTIFGYNYKHKDPKYGTMKVERIEMTDLTTFTTICPQCGTPTGEGGIEEQMPDENAQCMTCGYVGPMESIPQMEQIPQIVGFDESPKSSICQEVFTGMNVKVPAYARKQGDCGYLLLGFIQSTAMLRSLFKDKNISSRKQTNWENFNKIPLQYYGEMPDNASNVDCLWLRPWQFYYLTDQFKVDALLQQFPDGCYAIFVDDELMAAYNENMDEHWTIMPNPMGQAIYARPLGENLATVQDIRADLVEIEVQTAQFGIPETFADPTVLDFEKYGQGRAKPGMMTQARPKSGKTLAEAFHTTKPAILSQEIAPLKQQMDQDAQFVSGAFPSVYGGPSSGGSKTAAEYTQSSQRALQRLGTVNKIINEFWAQFQGRACTEYANLIKELGQDERFTKKEGNSSFVNVWIRAASLNGKIGRVEPESSDQLPVSWAQKKGAIEQLLALNNPEILAILGHPKNIEVMKDAFGLKEMFLPGEDDRTRQWKEFSLTAQGIQVPITPDVDNDFIHIEVLKSILEGPYRDNLSPEGFQATMTHFMEHNLRVQQQMAAQAEEQAQQQPDNETSKGME